MKILFKAYDHKQTTNSSLVFETKDGVFKKISDEAHENLRLSKEGTSGLLKEGQFEVALNTFKDALIDSEDKFSINKTAYIFDVEEDAFRLHWR